MPMPGSEPKIKRVVKDGEAGIEIEVPEENVLNNPPYQNPRPMRIAEGKSGGPATEVKQEKPPQEKAA
jgi:hypothetical protein